MPSRPTVELVCENAVPDLPARVHGAELRTAGCCGAQVWVSPSSVRTAEHADVRCVRCVHAERFGAPPDRHPPADLALLMRGLILRPRPHPVRAAPGALNDMHRTLGPVAAGIAARALPLLRIDMFQGT